MKIHGNAKIVCHKMFFSYWRSYSKLLETELWGIQLHLTLVVSWHYYSKSLGYHWRKQSMALSDTRRWRRHENWVRRSVWKICASVEMYALNLQNRWKWKVRYQKDVKQVRVKMCIIKNLQHRSVWGSKVPFSVIRI